MMKYRLLEFTGKLVCLILACTLAAPATGISAEYSSSSTGEAVVSLENFVLDSSTSPHESLALGSGSISVQRQAHERFGKTKK